MRLRTCSEPTARLLNGMARANARARVQRGYCSTAQQDHAWECDGMCAARTLAQWAASSEAAAARFHALSINQSQVTDPNGTFDEVDDY